MKVFLGGGGSEDLAEAFSYFHRHWCSYFNLSRNYENDDDDDKNEAAAAAAAADD